MGNTVHTTSTLSIRNREMGWHRGRVRGDRAKLSFTPTRTPAAHPYPIYPRRQQDTVNGLMDPLCAPQWGLQSKHFE